MATLITVFFGGVISALVTLLLGQPLQHYFWRRQRHAERQLTVIDEVNKLAGTFLYHCGTYYYDVTRLKLDNTFFQAVYAITGPVQSLFSEVTYKVFLQMVDVITRVTHGRPIQGPHQGPQQTQVMSEFMQARADALRALYADVGLPVTPPRQWLREGWRQACAASGNISTH